MLIKCRQFWDALQSWKGKPRLHLKAWRRLVWPPWRSTVTWLLQPSSNQWRLGKICVQILGRDVGVGILYTLDMFNSSESTVHCLHICYKDVFEGRVRQVDTLSWKFRDDSLRREDKTDVWSESNTLSLPWSYMCLVAYSVLSYFETSDKQVISFQGVMRKP